MRRRALGDLSVAVFGLGTMNWGTKTDQDEAAEQLRTYTEAGGNLLDTAHLYGHGRAEEIIGRLLGDVVARTDVVIATKAVGEFDGDMPRPNGDPDTILQELDTSLRRMGTDYVDLWQLHAWDPDVPLEATLEAVDTALRSGRVRQAGVCNYTGPQTRRAATWLRAHSTAPLVSLQVEYSLLERGIEEELVPAAADEGLGVLPWAPLGRGVLTGKYRQGVPEQRTASEGFRSYVGRFLDERSAAIVETVASVADGLGVSPLAVSLAWVRDRPGVVAPLIGARTAAQLRESVAEEVLNLTLPDDIVALLDKASK